MEEVNFIDQLRLVAVDHPVGTDVYPDERFLDDPPFASGAPVLTSAPHAPAGAWDDHGREVPALLSARDHQYVQDFTNLSFAGFANMHSLTPRSGRMDAAESAAALPARLHRVLQRNLDVCRMAGGAAADFAVRRGADAGWLLEARGRRHGISRRPAADHHGRSHRQAAARHAAHSHHDQSADLLGPDIGRQRPEQPNRIRTTELPLASATLAFRGYPRQVEGAIPGDLTYYYDQASTTGPFSQFRGSYTRYGDVTSLLQQVDDQFVIFGTGEDIDAEFSAAPLPPLAAGWTRDYFFYANGFVKDMDFYEASPFTVADMPFHAMTAYPYPAAQHYPTDSSADAYRLDWNDRYQRGSSTARGYSFQYRPRTIDPEPLTPGRTSRNATSNDQSEGVGQQP